MSRRRYRRRNKNKQKWIPGVEQNQLPARTSGKKVAYNQVSANQIYDVAEEIFKGIYWCIGDETNSTPNLE